MTPGTAITFHTPGMSAPFQAIVEGVVGMSFTDEEGKLVLFVQCHAPETEEEKALFSSPLSPASASQDEEE